MSSSVPTRFNEAHSDKPDSDEPWRYVCPDCEGQIAKSSMKKYRCNDCGKITHKNDLLDLKTGDKFHEHI